MRILMVSAYSYWGDFTPDDLYSENGKQIGGGETALIHVAKELAALGNEVFVFYDTARPGRWGGVDYMPTQLFPQVVCTLEHDVLVSWDTAHAFRFADRAAAHVLAFQLNEAFIGIFDHVTDLYMHPSEWHRDRYLEDNPEMDADKCRAQITNGIDISRYEQEGVEKQPHRIIYSSSPDRGLHHLLRWWEAIREQVPDAELHVFYDMDKWLQSDAFAQEQGLRLITSERADLIRGFREQELEGVQFHGGVGKVALAREQLASHLMVYPCDPVAPTEGFSMSCLEGTTAGCRLVTSDADALKELWASAPNAVILPQPDGDSESDALWIDTIVKELNEPIIEKVPVINRRYSWSTIAKQWQRELLECLQNKSTS